ncbi:PaaI family thioesterase [Nitratireductor kimnyeongensis]|uniref:PaaI family thioesterase n=1 Tax=Nitratireductor kimnyeongensis TaxID=430679 RepID=A0ABW0T8W4_9HYPH|nr:PaaI family thioesterase [Nitratireductor kimnyeongensis]QZZ35961.1 PaaI family thioesterase [Nitratireductor kimnyeongensis]
MNTQFEAEQALGAARETLQSVFAPWIQALAIEALSADETGVDFHLPENADLVHVGGVICGQATASAADTCAVAALSAANGRFRTCTTVDMTTHFIRPLKPGAVLMRVEILSNGRRMAYVRVEMRAEGDARLAFTATGAYAYLE